MTSKTSTTNHRVTPWIGLVTALAIAVLSSLVVWTPTAAAGLPQLTRYPYLTDVVYNGSSYNATVNWATDQSQLTGSATYGQAGVEAVTTHRAGASKLSIMVNGVPEYQWKAKITGLLPNTSYAYRVFFGNPPVVDLLDVDSSPTFTTPPAEGAATSFSFDVLGDWGTTDATGANPDQANLDALIANSGASFVLSAGDVAYPSGSQTNYGDLFQTGPNISSVFGPSFYKNIGTTIPMFGAPGNHGFSATFLNVWPEPTAPVLSSGAYQMDSYSVPGTNTANYPSVWYAFSVGNARFYVLTAAWANTNVGSGTVYSNDYAAHWTPTSPEYKWLANDLATHPSTLKFALFHYPMYSDNATETTDTFLHGPNSLAALLTQHGVQFVFNGHAHIYERNLQQPGESFVSYVTGGGGESLEPVSKSSAFDAYALGWSPTNNTGSAGGSAPVPSSAAQVFHFLHVAVNGNQVTVTPTNSAGQTFDVKTYTATSDTIPPTTTATGAVNGTWYRAAVTVQLSATDNVGGSGVAHTEYSLDGGALTEGKSVPVSVQGRHTLLYYSADVAGNKEGPHTLTFGIDTVRPTTRAPSVVTARRGHTATLKYRVNDSRPNGGTATVTIKIRNKAGKVLMTLGPASGKVVNKLLTWKFTVPRSWKAGTRRFSVYAKDRAGNKQANVASNKLIVK